MMFSTGVEGELDPFHIDPQISFGATFGIPDTATLCKGVEGFRGALPDHEGMRTETVFLLAQALIRGVSWRAKESAGGPRGGEIPSAHRTAVRAGVVGERGESGCTSCASADCPLAGFQRHDFTHAFKPRLIPLGVFLERGAASSTQEAGGTEGRIEAAGDNWSDTHPGWRVEGGDAGHE